MPSDLPHRNEDPPGEATGKHQPVRPHGSADLPGHTTGEFPTPVGMSSGPPAVAGYDIVGELGRGGMAVVFKAWDVANKRFVALKMIAPGLENDPRTRQRFLEEAKAHARLQHPNIVSIYQVGVAEEWPYFVLEFCGGGSLARRLAGNPIQPRAAAELVVKIADAMAYAHSQQVIHRDLKPANILLTLDGAPKIGDFGLSKRLDRDAGQSTRRGTIVGTANYLAPELLTGGGRTGGFAGDIYALGAILFEFLTGRPPFKGATLLETIEQIRSQRVIPPRRFEQNIPQELEAVCLKCLDRNPVQRYSTARELVSDLRRFLEGQPVFAKPLNGWQLTKEWAVDNTSIAIVLFLLSMILGALVLGAAMFFARL